MMHRTLPLFACSTYLALIGCSGAVPPEPSRESGPETVFSAEDKRAARALSVGSNKALRTATSPYEQAVICSMALEALEERLAETASPESAQLRALAQAKAIFEQRIRVARPVGSDEAQLASDRDEQAAAYPEAVARAQLAIGCIRQLI